jgi:hypothetical protein
MLDSTYVDCPYCGERIELVVDSSAAPAEYVEDCEVCCRPMIVMLELADDGAPEVSARSEQE